APFAAYAPLLCASSSVSPLPRGSGRWTFLIGNTTVAFPAPACRVPGADGRTRTGTALRPGDFKSHASTIPPRPRRSSGSAIGAPLVACGDGDLPARPPAPAQHRSRGGGGFLHARLRGHAGRAAA